MRIRAIEAIPVRIKIKPLKFADRQIDHGECIVVRVQTDDGIVGYGEAMT
jgi:L-alanine-DL-glutamate epimerase-like enolase superfamily enzyme